MYTLNTNMEGTTISCSNMPDDLLNEDTAKEHFKKFGQVLKIRIQPECRACTVKYDTDESAEAALLCAGEYKGQVFSIDYAENAKFNKSSLRQISGKIEDPDWDLDPEVKSELIVLGNIEPKQYNLRSKGMDVDASISKNDLKEKRMKKILSKSLESSSSTKVKEKRIRRLSSKFLDSSSLPAKVKDKKIKRLKVEVLKNLRTAVKKSVSPKVKNSPRSKPWTQQQLELLTTIKKPALTSEEKYKILEAKDKLVRLRMKKSTDLSKVRKTVGTCPDMCPEKERFMREVQHQIALYEQTSEGREKYHKLAIKEYSRSSADQESPLPYELRPVPVLKLTMSYLLHNIMDLCETPDVNIAEWYHFLWDRTRSIRKDITQQDLCCQGSVDLIEQCARFHIHCSARLVSEDPSVFDQKINTENLTKCLQTLKYMYHDLSLKGENCPNEPEFRAYIILLNLNDGNFMWEVQKLKKEVQKSQEVKFALDVHSSLDKNNYVKFFNLVKSTTYLNACILLRYFTQVRINALKAILKSYSPRVSFTQFSLSELSELLAFEGIHSTIDFLEYCNLYLNQERTHVILDRKSFELPSIPYILDRAVNVIESKRTCSVGEVICGKSLPPKYFETYEPHTSFDKNGYLNIIEFIPDIDFKLLENNGDTEHHKQKIVTHGKPSGNENIFKTSGFKSVQEQDNRSKSPLVSEDSSDKSKFGAINKTNQNIFQTPSIFKLPENDGKSKNIASFDSTDSSSIFSKSKDVSKGLFSQKISESYFGQSTKQNESVFEQHKQNESIFGKSVQQNQSLFGKPTTQSEYVFGKLQQNETIFGVPLKQRESVFGKSIKQNESLFGKNDNQNDFETGQSAKQNKSLFGQVSKQNENLFSGSIRDDYILNKATDSIFSQNIKPSTGGFSFNLPKSVDVSKENMQTGFSFKSKTEDKGASAFKVHSDGSKGGFRFSLPKGEDNVDVEGGQDKKVSQFWSKEELEIVPQDFQKHTPLSQNLLEFKNAMKPNKNQSNTQKLEERFKMERKSLDEHKKEIGNFENRPPEHEEKINDFDRKIQEEKTKLEEMTKQKETERLIEFERQREMKRKKEFEKQRELEKLKELEKQKQKEAQRKREIEKQILARKLEEEKRLEEIRRIEEEKRKQIEITEAVKSLLDDILIKVEDIHKNECLNIISQKIKKQKLLRTFLKWHEKVVFIKQKRLAINQSPLWVPKRRPEEEAKELFTESQEVTLEDMKRYKTGSPLDIPIVSEKIIDLINLNILLYPAFLKKMSELNLYIEKELFWKASISLPDHFELEYGCDKILDTVLSLFNFNGDIYCERFNSLFGNKISYSIENFKGIRSIPTSTNGLLFVCRNFDSSSIKRLECALKNFNSYSAIPLCVITEDKKFSDNVLDNLRKLGKIEDYTIFDSPFSTQNLIHLIKKSLLYLAFKYKGIPPLNLDLLKPFLSRYIGAEFWTRVESYALVNFPYKVCLTSPRIVIKLFNEALKKIKNIILDDYSLQYPDFPEEFKDCLLKKVPDCLPCDNRFFPHIWKSKSYRENLQTILDSLIMPNYEAIWPPKSQQDLERIVYEYCSKYFKYPIPNFYKVMTRIMCMFDHVNNFSGISNVMWSSVIELIISEKLEEVDFTLQIENCVFDEYFIVYDKSKVSEYESELWFYIDNPLVKKEINPKEYEMNLGPINRKRKFSDFIEIDLDKTLQNVMDDSLKNHGVICKRKAEMENLKKMMADLEESMKVSKEINVKVEEKINFILEG